MGLSSDFSNSKIVHKHNSRNCGMVHSQGGLSGGAYIGNLIGGATYIMQLGGF